MESHLETGALLAACLIALGAPAASCARALTAENFAELANVPPSWKDARICFREGGGVGGPRVVIGVESDGSEAAHFALRPERPEAILPGYLRNIAGELAEKQLSVSPALGVGYTDGYFDTFVMPSGVRMTCEELPSYPNPRRTNRK